MTIEELLAKLEAVSSGRSGLPATPDSVKALRQSSEIRNTLIPAIRRAVSLVCKHDYKKFSNEGITDRWHGKALDDDGWPRMELCNSVNSDISWLTSYRCTICGREK